MTVIIAGWPPLHDTLDPGPARSPPRSRSSSSRATRAPALQDIARAAGLTTGAIYANFRGKDELLFDAIGARAGVEMDALLAEARGRERRDVLEHARRSTLRAARSTGRRC